MKKEIKKFIKVWFIMACKAAQAQLINNWGGLLFLIGKTVRFTLTFVFVFTVLSGTGKLLNFSRDQIIVFFLVFNLIDVISEAIFRGVYWFRSLVISGDYDFDLLRPMPTFFRPIFGWADILDLITLVPLWIFFFVFIYKNGLMFSFQNFIIFSLFLFNSLLLSFAFHLAVCAICILTTEIDHLVWIYRDITGIAKVPTDIYPRLIQYFLTFVVPATVLVTIPAKALLGFLSWQWMVLSFVIGGLSLVLSFRLWKYALTRYSSASS